MFRKMLLAGSILLGLCPPVMADAQLDEAAATIINLNGFLCAKLTSIRPLDLRGGDQIFEVTCIKWRGGSKKATYILNGDTNVVFEDE